MNEDKSFENRVNLEAVGEAIRRIREEIGKILIGQAALVDAMIAAVLANGHVLIEGVPGIAKTLAAKLMARTISAEFARIQFTPDLMPADILGTAVFNPQNAGFEFKPGPVFSNIVLIDEVNRAPAKTQSALFEVMEERQITRDGTTYTLDRPFLVFATQNPIEHEGTYRLPEAQLDRFLFKLDVSYPSLNEEVAMLTAHHEGRTGDRLDLVRPVLSARDIVVIQKAVERVHVEPKIFGYIADIVRQTREHAALYLGASPRAAIALMRAARAVAAMQGRDFMTPEDVQHVAIPVLRHRVSLTPEQEMEGATPDRVLKGLVGRIEVPR